MFNWIKKLFSRVFTDKLRLDLAVSEQLQKANAMMIDDLQEKITDLQRQITENKKDILFLDKCDDNAKDRLSSLFSKLARIEETTVTKEELEGDLTKRANNTSNRLYQIEKKIDDFKEDTRQNIAWLDNITGWLEQEAYSMMPRINPRRLTIQASEDLTPGNEEKTLAKFVIAKLAEIKLFPIKKTEFNKSVYEMLKQRIESASRRKSRALVEELIKDGWLAETQDNNIKWINVRG